MLGSLKATFGSLLLFCFSKSTHHLATTSVYFIYSTLSYLFQAFSFYSILKMSLEFDLVNLSVEKYHQMKRNGFLTLLIDNLHKHTLKETDDRDMQTIIDDYLVDISMRRKLSMVMREIICSTAENNRELEILVILDTGRFFVEDLFVKSSNHTLTDYCAFLKQHFTQETDIFENMIEDFKIERECFINFDYDEEASSRWLGVGYVILDNILTFYRFHGGVCQKKHCLHFFLDSFDSLAKLLFMTSKGGFNPELYSLLSGSTTFINMLLHFLTNHQTSSESLSTVCLLISSLCHSNDYPIKNSPDVVKCLAQIAIQNPNDTKSLSYLFYTLGDMTESDDEHCEELSRVDGLIELIITIYVSDSSPNDLFPETNHVLSNISEYLLYQDSVLELFQKYNICGVLVKQLDPDTHKFCNYDVNSIYNSTCTILRNLACISHQERAQIVQLGAVERLQKLVQDQQDEEVRNSASLAIILISG